MVSNKFVIDTDCLNFLLGSRIGRKILRNCEILLPPSIFGELYPRQQNMIRNYNPKIINLDENDRNYASKLIHKISGKKEYKTWYIENRNLRRIRNIGECEGAAISKKINIDMVLLDKKATSVIKKTFKYLEIRCIHLREFGIMILEEYGSNNDIREYKEELKRKLHL